MNAETKKDFLFELGCEELPPKALSKLAKSLHDQLCSLIGSAGLSYSDSEWFATPRRLAVRFTGLDSSQKDKEIERLGPPVAAAFDDEGNPKPAAIGFAKSNAVSVKDLSTKKTSKGERLAFLANVKGSLTSSLLPEFVNKSIAGLPVPKSMRWGDSSIQFSRPVHWVLALFGEDVLPLNVFNIPSTKLSYGHRFHFPKAIEIARPADYEKLLSSHFVIACFEERKAKIRLQIEQLANSISAKAIIFEELLEEVTALVEWPIALMGNFDKEFLAVPSEALVSSMVEHQKYFHLEDSNGNLLPHFITVSNIESKNPQSVIDGNEKVIRPRLADAKFFYDSDCKKSLSSYTTSLKNVTFQNQLGSLFDKSQRVKNLSASIADQLSFDADLARRASELCKCDLMTDMVGEFGDLQGVMGRYYAIKDNEPSEISNALAEIYLPRFAGDSLPKTQTGLVLAIAERLDTLVGIFGIGQLPTGAKDPFALRRAALGILRLLTEKSLDLDLFELIDQSINTYSDIDLKNNTKEELLAFFSARMNAMYIEEGYSSQILKSVQALDLTKPIDFLNRIKAVKSFDGKSESKDLAEANKRVKNILAKSDVDVSCFKVNETLFEDEEKNLYREMKNIETKVNESLVENRYDEALTHLAQLKDSVNLFFDKVMINVENKEIKNNRLALISELRSLFVGIADISLLQK